MVKTCEKTTRKLRKSVCFQNLATEELAHWSLRGSINLPHLWGTQHPLPRLPISPPGDLVSWIQGLRMVENDTFRWNVPTHSNETDRFAVIICSPHIEFESTIFYSSPVPRPGNHTKTVPWPCQIGCSTWNLLPSSSITQRNSPASALSSTSPGLTISQKRRDLLGWQTSWIFRSVWFIAASWFRKLWNSNLRYQLLGKPATWNMSDRNDGFKIAVA